jgi:hypothetical protein
MSATVAFEGEKTYTPSDCMEWEEGDPSSPGGGAGESYVDAKKARVFEWVSELAISCGVWGRCNIGGNGTRVCEKEWLGSRETGRGKERLNVQWGI